MASLPATYDTDVATEQDPRRWLALAAICAAQFMVVLDIAIVNVALPSIQSDLHFSQESLQWVLTAYSIMFGGFLMLGGRVADLGGRRRVFMAGVVLFTASSLLCGLAWNEGSLIAFRAAQGLGGALLSPAALSILTTTFAEGRERNLALGVWGAIAGTGAAAGTLLGGVLTSRIGWEWIFFVNVPVGAAVAFASPVLLRESRVAHRKGFDVAGAVSITASMMLLVYSMTYATEHGWGNPRTIIDLVVAAALLVAFVVIEMNSKAPILPLGIFRLGTLRAANVIGFLVGCAIFSQFFLLSLYMQQVLHYSAMQTGAAYIAITATIIVFAGVAQGLVTRIGVRPVLTVGLALAALALVGYSRVPVDGTYVPDLLVPFLIGGIGLGLTFVPIQIASLTGVTGDQAGVASGLINTSQQIGGAIGLALASTIATTWTSNYATDHGVGAFDPNALVHGFQAAFYVLIALSVVAVVAAATLIRAPRPGVEPEPALAASTL
jgi:EmrB/QacA subfamily drug resistance transporter